jgi:membrane associated rhomboid family serine protease
LPGILGYTLVHSRLSIFHLLFNGYMFALFAPEIERLFPGKFFMVLMLKAALAGAVTTLVLYWLMPATFGHPVIGGSGLVTAVFAASAAMYPGRIMNLLFLRIRLITFFLVLIGLDLLFFFGNILGSADGVAHHVHLAGAFIGWTAVGGFQRFDGPWKGWIEKSARKKTQKQQRQSQNDEAELDRILAKISREGLPSLTAKERQFLEQRSKR